MDGREPSLYIGGKPFYINFVEVDKKTREESEKSDKGKFVEESWDGYFKAFGIIKTPKKSKAV